MRDGGGREGGRWGGGQKMRERERERGGLVERESDRERGVQKVSE